ncbi:MAG: DNA polymerase [Planctomycetota bacterium]|nr:DNA polymerase [Planctomycetota bacterium]
MIKSLYDFEEIVTADFEYYCPNGEIPVPICMGAHESISGRKWVLWADELQGLSKAPFRTDPGSLFVCFSATAELSCFLSMSWPEPHHLLDLYAEERNLENGRITGKGQFKLPAVLKRYGLDSLIADHKEENQKLAQKGFPFTEQQKKILLQYVWEDTVALDQLYPLIFKRIRHHTLTAFRGGYQKAVARTENHGIPLDPQVDILKQLLPQRLPQLVQEVDLAYGFFNGMRFEETKFASYVEARNINWPITEKTQKYRTDKNTLSDMCKIHPEFLQFKELKKTLIDREIRLTYGRNDYRNRTWLGPYVARTGRNQPSGSEFIFGRPKWFRFLIKPEEGYSLFEIDYSAQEIAIAAGLSNDPNLKICYGSGDAYEWMARESGRMPAHGTKLTHPAVRNAFKKVNLAVNYGAEAYSLARWINGTEAEAQSLLRWHRNKFPDFWDWQDQEVSYALLKTEIMTNYGWSCHLVDEEVKKPNGECYIQDTNLRSVQNFHMQAHAVHVLQWAMMRCWDAGLKIAAPVHDSILFCSPTDRVEKDIKTAVSIMTECGEIVLGGFRIRVDVKRCDWPDRFGHEDGAEMWGKVCKFIPELTP